MAGNGFFRSAFRALVDARMAQAERYVNEALLYLDDETLEAVARQGVRGGRPLGERRGGQEESRQGGAGRVGRDARSHSVSHGSELWTMSD